MGDTHLRVLVRKRCIDSFGKKRKISTGVERKEGGATFGEKCVYFIVKTVRFSKSNRHFQTFHPKSKKLQKVQYKVCKGISKFPAEKNNNRQKTTINLHKSTVYSASLFRIDLHLHRLMIPLQSYKNKDIYLGFGIRT